MALTAVKAPGVPPTTTTSEAEKPVTGSLKVKVYSTGPVAVPTVSSVMVMVGAVASKGGRTTGGSATATSAIEPNFTLISSCLPSETTNFIPAAIARETTRVAFPLEPTLTRPKVFETLLPLTVFTVFSATVLPDTLSARSREIWNLPLASFLMLALLVLAAVAAGAACTGLATPVMNAVAESAATVAIAFMDAFEDWDLLELDMDSPVR